MKAMAAALLKKDLTSSFRIEGEVEGGDAQADDPDMLDPGDEVDEELVRDGVVPPAVVSSGPPGEYAVWELPELDDERRGSPRPPGE